MAHDRTGTSSAAYGIDPGPNEDVLERPLNGGRRMAATKFPVVLCPEHVPNGARDLGMAARDLVGLSEKQLLGSGAILFRGFNIREVDEFYEFVSAYGHDLLSYEYASTPRTQVREGVYTSTEYPARQTIPLHNEQSYTTRWPLKIWFCCVKPSEIGGETPIADSRQIYKEIPYAIREKFERLGLIYVRNYGGGLDVPWEKVFGTTDRGLVERYCKKNEIRCEWKRDGSLRTYQRCQATAVHPVTGESVWFNQAHLFHVSGLAQEVREALLDVVSPEDLPRNVIYGNGDPIGDETLHEVREVLERRKVTFSWEVNDVLLLDNMLAAHGREPFQGKRTVVVAMTEEYVGSFGKD